MNLTRRTLFASAPLALGGCTAITSVFGAAATPAEIITDIGAAVTGLANGLNVIKGSSVLAPYASLMAKIEADLTGASAVVTGLSTNLPATTGATIVQTVEGYLNDVLSVATTPPLSGLIPPPFSTALGLVAVVLPTIEAFVNQYLPAPAAPVAAASLASVAAQTRALALAPAGLTVQQAVQQLQGIK